MRRIAPSIMSADFARLGEEVRAALAAGADWIHFDVMDNHYVPNLTIGPMVAQAIKPQCVRPDGTTATLDAHLMVKPVDALASSFAKSGADLVSFHPEASAHSVNPGFGGQSIIDSALREIEKARALIDASGRDIRLEVDGGIKVDNIRRFASAGADTFVAGSAIFGRPDYRVGVEAMRRELAPAQPNAKVA